MLTAITNAIARRTRVRTRNTPRQNAAPSAMIVAA